MNTKSQNNTHTIRNLTIFTFLMISIGWLGRWVDSVMGSASSEGIGMLIWIVAPLGVSFLLRGFAGDGWKDLGIKPGIKGNVLWYAVSILVYPICILLILLIGKIFGVVSFPDFSSDKLGLLVQGFALLIFPQLFQNIFEEFGFRGYLAPKLYKLRLNIFVAHVIVGLIWGIWHLPYLRAITPYTTESLATLIPRFLAGAIAVSIVYGEIRIRTNSVLPAVLMQTFGGAFVGAIVLKDVIKVTSGMEVLFAPVLEGGLCIVLFFLIGVGIYMVKRKRTTTVGM